MRPALWSFGWSCILLPMRYESLVANHQYRIRLERYDSRLIWLLIALLASFFTLPLPANTLSDQQSKTSSTEIQQEMPVLIARFISINGGGGETSDGVLTIHGTIGQPQTGDSVSCGLKSSNGFWSITAETDLDPIFGNSFEFDFTCK